LWKADKKKNASKILELVGPFVGARLVLCNVDGWEELFADPRRRRMSGSGGV